MAAGGDFYQKWRANLRQWVAKRNTPPRLADVILVLPDFVHLLVRLMADERMPLREKLIIGSALAYFALPIDLAAEIVLGPIGYLDDILLALFILDRMVNKIDASILREHWAGDGDVLLAIRSATGNVQEIIGPGFRGRFARIFSWISSSERNNGSRKEPA